MSTQDSPVNEMAIRVEEPADRPAVAAIIRSAFASGAEVGLVEELRERADPIVSLIAEYDGEVVGHIMFSPVTLSGHPQLVAMGLAPMAVTPMHQRKGIGSALVRAGLEECRRLGSVAVVVLGHPGYYPRFGFEPAVRFDLGGEYDVPEEVFMAMELRPGALDGMRGLIKYHPAFGEL